MAPGNESRERMLTAALELLGERGYNNITMVEVTDRAGTPRGSMYHLFPGGKEELVIAALAKARAGTLRGVARISERTGSAAAFLDAVITFHAGLLTKANYGVGCPIMGIIVNVPPEATALWTNATDALTEWVDAIANGLRAKGIEHSDAIRAASVLVSLIEGAIVLSRASRNSAPFDDIRAWIPAVLRNAEESEALLPGV